MAEPVIIGNATLYLGSCEDILPTLPKVDAVVTDPPYGIGANKRTLGSGKKQFHRGDCDWDARTPPVLPWVQMARWAIVWGGNYFANELPANNHWLVWHKKNDNLSFSECELAWTNLGKQVRHISHHWGREEKEHPTQKPLRVMKWCVGLLPDDAESILDPFMGSGTTGVAALLSGRKFIGIEREPRYFEAACRRIRETTGEDAGPLFGSAVA